jgi:hypothetical protein
MMERDYELRGSYSNSNKPCLGVGGGAYRSTFSGRILLRSNALPEALFVRSRGQLACSLEQAIIPAQLGDVVVNVAGKLPATPDNPDIEIKAYKIVSVSDIDGIPVFTVLRCEVPPLSIFPWEALGTYHNRDGKSFVKWGSR